ncbi:MAG TPA: cupin domain-containing protein [Gaiellaceae bacterium]|nr:cupin domain-containing protein [Gaiellaceae bacterium]
MEAGRVTTLAEALGGTANGSAPTVAGGALEQHVIALAPGTTLHRAGERAETLFVASGRGALRVGPEEHGLVAETGILLAPGEVAELEVEEELRLVRALAPAGEARTPRTVRYADEEARDAGIGREFRLLCCTAATTQFVGLVPPGRAKMHNHPYDEVAYVVEGTGVLHWEDGPDEPVGGGSCIFFPRLVFHSLENTGDDTLRIMGVLEPAHSPADRVRVLDW